MEDISGTRESVCTWGSCVPATKKPRRWSDLKPKPAESKEEIRQKGFVVVGTISRGTTTSSRWPVPDRSQVSLWHDAQAAEVRSLHYRVAARSSSPSLKGRGE